MIKAEMAKRESILNSKALKYMDNFETEIKKAIKKGRMSATIYHRIEDNKEGEQLIDAIKQKMEELGYICEFVFAKPLPSGCPSDQWFFDNGYITVKWD